MIDLLVVGAGPVGLVTSIYAAQKGLEVTVVEPRIGEVDKACGEGLMPDALERLFRIGIDPAGIDFFGIRYLAGKRIAEARFFNGTGRGVRRTTLQNSLQKRAREVGVNFIEGRVQQIEQCDTSVDAAGIQCRYLIGADGLHSNVRRQLGLSVVNKRKNDLRFGIRQHFSTAPWSDLVEVYWLSDAEVYITPVDQEIVGVAVLGQINLDLRATISRIPELVDRLASAEPASKLRGAGPLRQRVRTRSIGRVLLVGDAAGYVDALTGEGLGVGFAEAEAAVRAVIANDPDSYEAEWQRITRSYRWLTGGLLWASSNRRIRPMIVPSARALPTVFRRLVNTLK